MLNREELEAEAKELGLKFPANIGDEKLAERVAEARKAKADAELEENAKAEAEAKADEDAKAAQEETFAHVSNAGPMVAVNCAIPGGRRRGGRRWPGGVTQVPLDDFTEAMANALDRDPMFTMVMPD